MRRGGRTLRAWHSPAEFKAHVAVCSGHHLKQQQLLRKLEHAASKGSEPSPYVERDDPAKRETNREIADWCASRGVREVTLLDGPASCQTRALLAAGVPRAGILRVERQLLVDEAGEARLESALALMDVWDFLATAVLAGALVLDLMQSYLEPAQLRALAGALDRSPRLRYVAVTLACRDAHGTCVASRVHALDALLAARGFTTYTEPCAGDAAVSGRTYAQRGGQPMRFIPYSR